MLNESLGLPVVEGYEMNQSIFDQRKAQFIQWESRLSERNRMIFRVAAALEILMVLWCPKVVEAHMMGVSKSASVGYGFILSNPAGSEFASLMGVSVHIDYLRLLVQMLVVGGIAYAMIRNPK